MGFQFEVSQVDATAWTPKQNDGWSGVYVEIYLNKAKKHMHCKPTCFKREKKQVRARSTTIDEAKEMRWRKTNSEGFLLSLFVLGEERKRRKKGDELVLTLELMQVTDLGQLEGRKVGTFKGSMKVGAWGPVVLQQTDHKDIDSGEGAKFVLETRPISARPFSLENARPLDDPGSLAMIMSVFAASSAGPVEKQSRQKRRDRRLPTWAKLSNLLTTRSPEWDSTGESPGGQDAPSPWAPSSIRAALPPTRAAGPFARLTAVDRLDALEGLSEYTFGSTASSLSGDDVSMYQPAAGTAESTTGGLSFTEASWGRMLGLSKLSQASASDYLKHWTPTDWDVTWHGGKDLKNVLSNGGSNIVVLMETECRRDCVILFSTLYPTVDGHSFQRLRHQALLGAENGFGFRKVHIEFGLPKFQKQKQISETSHEREGGARGSGIFNIRSMHSVISRIRHRPSQASYTASPQADWTSDSLEPEPQLSEALPASEAEEMDVFDADMEVGSREQDRLNFCTFVSEGVTYSSSGSVSISASRRLLMRDSSDDDFSDVPEEGKRWEYGDSQTQQCAETQTARVAEHSFLTDAVELVAVSATRTLESRQSVSSVEEGDELQNKRGVQAPGPRLLKSSITPFIVLSRDLQYLSSSVHDVNLETCGGSHILVDDFSPRIMFLKRLMLCFAMCGVYYSETGNTEQLGDLWPYPLASVLGHGSRVLIRLEDVESSEFLNFLLSGNPYVWDWKSGIPPPLKRRIAATHSVELTDTGQVVEKKLRTTSATDTVQNLSDGIRGKHMGLDLPIGGPGNPSPFGKDHIVGFRGEVIRKKGPEETPGKRGLWTSSARAASKPAADAAAIPDWKLEGRMQGGHLYIRMDDFGWVSCQKTASGSDRLLPPKPSAANVHSELTRLRQRVEHTKLPSGDLIFPSSIPYTRVAATGAGNSLRLVKVSSEPNLRVGGASATATHDDIAWVGKAIACKENVSLPTPPSSTALSMLLEFHDPVNAQLYGTGNFKSIDALYEELVARKSILSRSARGGLKRFCKPIILQLRYKQRVLMKIAELNAGSDVPLHKPSFIVISSDFNETWRSAAKRVLRRELGVQGELLSALKPSALNDEECLTILTETTSSPSYPGMDSVYRTHMVYWEVEESRRDALDDNGFLYPYHEEGTRSSGLVSTSSGSSGKSVESLPFNCHFTTMRTISVKTPKKLFWRWVPCAEAQGLQRFINMGEATADERWAKYAFQKEGVVQFPPTQAALRILLSRCGIDVDKFGTGQYRSLEDFWLDLTAKESLLQMSKGQPLRLANSTVVRVVWKLTGKREPLILVKDKNSRKKLLTRRMLLEETWEESALSCLDEDLSLRPGQARNLLAHRAGDKSCYTFLEELTESDKYPGIKCLYRTHLVTYTVKEDFGLFLSTRVGSWTDTGYKDEMREDAPMIAQASTAGSKVAKLFMIPSPTQHSLAEDTDVYSRKKTRASNSEFIWLPESTLTGVKGANLWDQALKQQERHRVCSVLLGLEGSAPSMRSPFGIEHDGSGKSAPISALGNCKWSFYRKNNALQVPADQGGMRMVINQAMFHDIRSTCARLDLLDPSCDIVRESGQSRTRDVTDHRFAEREFFKRLLSSNAVDAKNVVEWMEDYRLVNKTMRAKYSVISGDLNQQHDIGEQRSSS
eukprot:TRINITY_DN3751_c0_g2_i1.p1 TRINITY_DN3751_c0_g2~~TRINITY_DN3751_c0_g2_i1.p1  ORF type:complete len:1658 (-),score=286.43 TRINITY_DN3751_c0_g2_i1:137-5110(-)